MDQKGLHLLRAGDSGEKEELPLVGDQIVQGHGNTVLGLSLSNILHKVVLHGGL